MPSPFFFQISPTKKDNKSGLSTGNIHRQKTLVSSKTEKFTDQPDGSAEVGRKWQRDVDLSIEDG